MNPDHQATFQMSSRDIDHAAVARRCVFYFPNAPQVRSLLDAYERREPLPVPAKALLNARTELYHEAARVLREVV